MRIAITKRRSDDSNHVFAGTAYGAKEEVLEMKLLMILLPTIGIALAGCTSAGNVTTGSGERWGTSCTGYDYPGTALPGWCSGYMWR